MGNKIREIITKNIIWKIVAIALAVVLWFIAVNIENPIKNRTILLSLEIRNEHVLEEHGMTLLNADNILQHRITLRLRGQTRTVDALRTEDLSLFIDLGTIHPSNFGNSQRVITTRIFAEFPSGVEQSIEHTLSLTEVEIVLDFIDSREFDVGVRLLGELEEGHIVRNIALEPNTVTVSGANSILNRVNEVVVYADISDLNYDFVANLTPTIYDINNQNLTNLLSIDTNEIFSEIQIRRLSEIAILQPMISGHVASGYTISNITMSQHYVEVYGHDEDILALSRISLAPISVSNARTTVTAEYDITHILEEYGLSLKEGFSPIIEVRVIVESEVTRTFNVPIENFIIVGENPYVDVIFNDYVEVRLRGRNNEIFALNESDITGSIDISGLSSEDHEALVVLNPIAGMTQISNVYVGIFIDDGSENLEEDTETEDIDNNEEIEDVEE